MQCGRMRTARNSILMTWNSNMQMERLIGDAVEEGEFDPVKTPYVVDEKKFPIAASLEEQFAFLLRYAILAPSSYNTQPWKFELRDDGIAVYADYTRRLPVADPGAGNS